jgi:hypothetical protein
MEDLEERLKTQEAEVAQLREIIEYNKQELIKKRIGRPTKYVDRLDETVCFKVTKKQKEKLDEILKFNGREKSEFIRQMIFGED